MRERVSIGCKMNSNQEVKRRECKECSKHVPVTGGVSVYIDKNKKEYIVEDSAPYFVCHECMQKHDHAVRNAFIVILLLLAVFWICSLFT